MQEAIRHTQDVAAARIERSTTQKQRARITQVHDAVRGAGYSPLGAAPAAEVTLDDAQLARLNERRIAQLTENSRRRAAGETEPVASGLSAAVYRKGTQGFAGNVKSADVWPIATKNAEVVKTIKEVSESAAREFGGSISDDLQQELMIAAVEKWLPKYVSERAVGARDESGRLVAAATDFQPSVFEQAGVITRRYVPAGFTADFVMNRDDHLAKAANAASTESTAGAFVGAFARRAVSDLRNGQVNSVSMGQKAARDADFTHGLDETHEQVADRTERPVDAAVAHADLIATAIAKVTAELADHPEWKVGGWTVGFEDIAAYQPGQRGALLELWGDDLDPREYDQRRYIVKKAKAALATALTRAGVTPELLAA